MAGCRPRSRSSPDNRVRLTVQVPSHDVHHAVEHAADDLARASKIPGFRKGKVPRQVLLQRVGKERLMTEAIESHIGGWFWNAAARTRCGPSSSRSTTSSCRQRRRGLAVHRDGRRAGEARGCPTGRSSRSARSSPRCPRSSSSAELDALRATVAELVPVEGRPVARTTP